MRRAVLIVTLLLSSGTAVAQPMPTIEEAASRAALQDQLGARCAEVAASESMRRILTELFKRKEPERWSKAYLSATSEIADLLSRPSDASTMCAAALELYGPQGSVVPRLLVPKGR